MHIMLAARFHFRSDTALSHPDKASDHPRLFNLPPIILAPILKTGTAETFVLMFRPLM
jgi:hypothetical protein